MNVRIKHVPQDTEWTRSFNVLVPLDIQGKEGVLVQRGTNPTIYRGSVGHTVLIDNKPYCLPCWSVVDDCGASVKPS